MVKQTEKNYTEAQEAVIRSRFAEKGPLTQADAEALAVQFGKTTKSVVAKITRMNDVTYKRKTPVTKSGEPVVRKETLVERIAEYVDGSLDGLDKASKPALVNILATLEAMADEISDLEASTQADEAEQD